MQAPDVHVQPGARAWGMGAWAVNRALLRICEVDVELVLQLEPGMELELAPEGGQIWARMTRSLFVCVGSHLVVRAWSLGFVWWWLCCVRSAHLR